MLLDLLGKKSTSLYIAIFMNDLAIEIKNVGLGIRVGDHDPFHSSIMHKIQTKQVTELVAVEKVAQEHILTKCCERNTFQVISDLVHDFRNLNALKFQKFISHLT